MAVRVLIADDAMFMREMIKDILRQGGYEVVGEAGDGNEALSKFRELRPDIMTMDIVMPRKSGIEALREIRQENGDVKIVMISALGQDSLVVEALEAGAKDFIVKPFQADKVLDVLKKVSQGA